MITRVISRAAHHLDHLDRLDAGGYLLAIASLLILAPAVLLPAHLEVRELTRQRDQLHDATQTLTAQRDNYHTLLASLDQQDPILLTRLAWHELRLKPTGTQPLNDHPTIDNAAHRLNQWTSPHTASNTPAPDTTTPIDTAFVQLNTGPHRPYLFALAAILAGASLLTSFRKTTRE